MKPQGEMKPTLKRKQGDAAIIVLKRDEDGTDGAAAPEAPAP